MLQATRSHSAKVQAGGTGDFNRKARTDFKRDFFFDSYVIPPNRAAVTSTRFSFWSAKIRPAWHWRNWAQSFAASRETARLRRGFGSMALRVAAILAAEYTGQFCFGKLLSQSCQMLTPPKANWR